MKPLRVFRATGDCGCSGGSVSTSQTLTPSAPGSALICDDKYLLLGKATAIRMLGTTLDGACQVYLKAVTQGDIGFVFMAPDGAVHVDRLPHLWLPPLNPASGGIFPATGSFQYLQVADGVGDPEWRFIAAPSVGRYTVVSEDGMFSLVDASAGESPVSVCESEETAAFGNIVCCVQTEDLDELGDPIFILRKLTPSHEHPLIGFIDEDGNPGFRCIADGETLHHPLAAFNDLKAGKYQQINPANGALLGNGLELQDATDTDYTTEIAGYSGENKKFYRMPARTKENVTIDADVAVADNGTFVSMGTHAKFTALLFNYPDAYFSTVIRLANDADNYAAINYGLYVDGVQVHVWDVKGSKDVNLSHIIKGMTIGNHTIEVKFQQTAAAGASTIKYSDTQIFTVL